METGCFGIDLLGFSLLRIPVSLLLEYILDASSVGWLIGLFFMLLDVYGLIGLERVPRWEGRMAWKKKKCGPRVLQGCETFSSMPE